MFTHKCCKIVAKLIINNKHAHYKCFHETKKSFIWRNVAYIWRIVAQKKSDRMDALFTLYSINYLFIYSLGDTPWYSLKHLAK